MHLPDPDLLPNVEELVEECKGFPNAAHDDTVDAMSQALNRLLLMPLLVEDTIDGGDLIDDMPDYLTAGY